MNYDYFYYNWFIFLLQWNYYICVEGAVPKDIQSYSSCLSIFSRLFRKYSKISEYEVEIESHTVEQKPESDNYRGRCSSFSNIPEIKITRDEFVDDVYDSIPARGMECEPITQAAELGLLPYLRDIISRDFYGVNSVDANGKTPLIIACEKNLVECASLLIKSGADLNVRSNDGTTALMRAVSNDNIAIVIMLLNAGAAIDIMDEDVTILDLSILSTSDTSIAKLLLSKGLDVSDGHSLALAKELGGRKAHVDLLSGNKLDIKPLEVKRKIVTSLPIKIDSIPEDEEDEDSEDDNPDLVSNADEGSDENCETAARGVELYNSDY